MLSGNQRIKNKNDRAIFLPTRNPRNPFLGATMGTTGIRIKSIHRPKETVGMPTKHLSFEDWS